jgi:hypothetical protein
MTRKMGNENRTTQQSSKKTATLTSTEYAMTKVTNSQAGQWLTARMHLSSPPISFATQ